MKKRLISFAKKYITRLVNNNINKREVNKIALKMEKCPHEKWDMDIQIRIIKCQKCGKLSWVEEYKDLFPFGLFKEI